MLAFFVCVNIYDVNAVAMAVVLLWLQPRL